MVNIPQTALSISPCPHIVPHTVLRVYVLDSWVNHLPFAEMKNEGEISHTWRVGWRQEFEHVEQGSCRTPSSRCLAGIWLDNSVTQISTLPCLAGK